MAEVSIGRFKLYTEIPVLLLFYSFALNGAVNSNFIIYRTCYVTLGCNESDCAALGSQNASQELEEAVEPTANVIMTSTSLLSQIIPALMCLFVGPWSDKNGRKPIMVISLFGFVISGLAQIVITLLKDVSPWYLLLSSLPVTITGGFALYLMVVLCNITDVTDDDNRGVRIGVFEAVVTAGLVLGSLSSSYMFNVLGYVGVFGVSTGCMLGAWVYTLYFVSESVTRTDEISYNIFTTVHVRDMFRTTFKKREHHTRSVLLITMIVTIGYVLSSNADMNVIFLYFRKKFGWTLEKYNLYSSVRNTCFIGGAFIGVYLMHKVCKVPEPFIIFMGLLCFTIGAVLQGVATVDWHLYVAGGIRCFGAVISPMCRSLISKQISPDENGKVFSLTVCLEMLSMIIGSPVYVVIYNSTLDTNSGIFNFVTAGISSVQILLVMAVIGLKLRSVNPYHVLETSIDAIGEQ